MSGPSTIYERLLAATSELLGPASERFLLRQIDNHLQKDPEKLTPADISELSEWLRLSMGLLTDDVTTLQEYNQALRELADG